MDALLLTGGFISEIRKLGGCLFAIEMPERVDGTLPQQPESSVPCKEERVYGIVPYSTRREMWAIVGTLLY
jgi:hypothetical protein